MIRRCCLQAEIPKEFWHFGPLPARAVRPQSANRLLKRPSSPPPSTSSESPSADWEFIWMRKWSRRGVD